MSALQELLIIALSQMHALPPSKRSALLKEAAKHLPKPVSAVCLAESICLDNAERYQLKLKKILEEVAS